jgi:hypothetical protein
MRNRTKSIDIIKRDNLIVELLLDHKGKENALSRYTLAKCLTDNGYATKPQTVHSVVSRVIKERHLPICSLNGKGYYWAKTKADILSCIEHLQSRVDSLTEHINHLKNFIME